MSESTNPRRARWLAWAALTALAASCGSSPLDADAAPPHTGAAGTGAAGSDASAVTGSAGFNDGGAGSSGAAGQAPTDAGAGPDGEIILDISASIDRDLDIVFMVDNSLSMMPLQNKLAEQFPAFMNVLTMLPGGLPNVHIGVVTSDLGAGQYSAAEIFGCRPGGDQGIFQAVPRNAAACAKGMLDAGQNFIIASNAAGSGNFTGDIADAFGCIALVGDEGCGFEHQLASVLRGLGADGSPAPAQNANFLRPNAYLAVVLLTNEDDCSAPPNSTLFDPASRLVSDQLGPLASYRCNEFGHLCGGKAPPRTSTTGEVDLSGTCVSNEDGPLDKVGDFVAKLKGTKADPSKVFVAAITAPPTPYIVGFAPGELQDDPSPWPYIMHSCTAADGTYGDPAVRLEQAVRAFGARGVFETICADSFAPALEVIASGIGQEIGVPCVNGKVPTKTGPNGARAACTVSDHTFNSQGMTIDTPLPSCVDTNNVAPCWALATDAACPLGALVKLNRGAIPQPTDLDTTVDCPVCTPASTDPSCH